MSNFLAAATCEQRLRVLFGMWAACNAAALRRRAQAALRRRQQLHLGAKAAGAAALAAAELVGYTIDGLLAEAPPRPVVEPDAAYVRPALWHSVLIELLSKRPTASHAATTRLPAVRTMAAARSAADDAEPSPPPRRGLLPMA